MSCYLNDVQYLQNVAFSFEKAQKLKIVPPQIPTTQSKKCPQQNFPFPPILGEFPLMPLKMLVSGSQNVGKILDLSAGLSLLLPLAFNALSLEPSSLQKRFFGIVITSFNFQACQNMWHNWVSKSYQPSECKPTFFQYY